MTRAEIENLVRTWAQEVVAAGRVDVFDDLLADDVLDRSGAVAAHGRDSFKARARAVAGAFGDRAVTVDSLIVEGDAVAWRWTVTGTHVGPFGDLAPTQRRIVFSGVNFQRVRDGRVVEHWTLADLAGLRRQLS